MSVPKFIFVNGSIYNTDQIKSISMDTEKVNNVVMDAVNFNYPDGFQTTVYVGTQDEADKLFNWLDAILETIEYDSAAPSFAESFAESLGESLEESLEE